MGVPPETLSATVARYNELCAKGHDDDFYKLPNYLKPIETGPFFAIRCQGIRHAPEKLVRRKLIRGRASGLSRCPCGKPRAERARAPPSAFLCYLQSLSIFRFRLSKSTPRRPRRRWGKLRDGGRTWTRTRDLFLIREAL